MIRTCRLSLAAAILIPFAGPAAAQSSRWDAVLSNSNWYVPTPYLPAYAASASDFTRPPPVQLGDQTLWTLGTATNGVFRGLSTASMVGGPIAIESNTVMNGIVTDDGQVRIRFSSTSGSPVVGIGRMTEVGGQTQVLMQMITAGSLTVTHWAFMAQYDPATFTPPDPHRLPGDITARNWDWVGGTTWRMTAPSLFGTAAPGTFRLTDSTNGYVWGPGASPGGMDGTNFTQLGSITPDGTVLLGLNVSGVLTYFTGRITGDASTGRMALRVYTGGDVGEVRAVAEVMSPSPIAAGLTLYASGLGSSVIPAFTGGRLQVDTVGQAYTQAFTLDGSSTNTIDQRGGVATFTGVFADSAPGVAGRLAIANSASGGRIVMTGASTYTGPTTVGAGAVLQLDGSVVSPVAVQAGGTLRGTGTAGGGVVVAAGGTLAPGGSPGTLFVNGPLVLAASATSAFDIDGAGTSNGAGNHSRVLVNGAASADGVLAPRLRGISGAATNTFSPVLGQSFAVIGARDGLAGSFASITQPDGLAPGTRFDALYGAGGLSLVVTPSSYAARAAGEWSAPVGLGLDAARPAAGPAMTAEQASVYAPLYPLGQDQIVPALRQIAPLAYGDSLLANRAAFQWVNGAVNDAMAARRGPGRTADTRSTAAGADATAWITTSGQFLNLAGDGTPGFSGSLAGVVVGLDTPVAQGLVGGVAVGFAHQSANAGNGGSWSGQSVQVQAYATATHGPFFLDTQAGVAFTEGSADRALPVYGSNASGDTRGGGLGGSIRAGGRWDAQGWGVEPSIMLAGAALRRDGTTETGAGGLTIAGANLGSLRTVFGVQFDRRIPIGEATAVVPMLRVGWAYEALDTSTRTSAAFLAVPGAAFALSTPSIGRSAAIVGLHARLDTGSPLEAFAGYDAALNARSSAQTVTAGVRYRW